jgi:hypothetical protein
VAGSNKLSGMIVILRPCSNLGAKAKLLAYEFVNVFMTL